MDFLWFAGRNNHNSPGIGLLILCLSICVHHFTVVATYRELTLTFNALWAKENIMREFNVEFCKSTMVGNTTHQAIGVYYNKALVSNGLIITTPAGRLIIRIFNYEPWLWYDLDWYFSSMKGVREVTFSNPK